LSGFPFAGFIEVSIVDPPSTVCFWIYQGLRGIQEFFAIPAQIRHPGVVAAF
jgi:hypothetical protein